jgi:hypothetical protein
VTRGSTWRRPGASSSPWEPGELDRDLPLPGRVVSLFCGIAVALALITLLWWRVT